MKRGLLRAGLVAAAPCVLLLVALPVGFVMELGKQVRLRVANRSGRPLRVTPLGGSRDQPQTLRAAPLTIHPFLPLPALRAADLPLAPGESRVLHYSARAVALRALAVRESDGRLRRLDLPAPVARRDVETGRDVVLDAASPLVDGLAPEVLDGHRPWLAWLVLIAGPAGTFAFIRLRRALQRPS